MLYTINIVYCQGDMFRPLLGNLQALWENRYKSCLYLNIYIFIYTNIYKYIYLYIPIYINKYIKIYLFI